MASQLASLESATKYLTPQQKEQFYKLKRELEAAGTSKKNLEQRLHAFMWDIVESDDEDEDGDEDHA